MRLLRGPLKRLVIVSSVLLGAGLVVLVVAVAAFLALGGLQFGAYGGLTAEQLADQDRAERLSSPVFLAGSVLALAGLSGLVVALVRTVRKRAVADSPNTSPS